jgi:hypothetical protein
MNKEIELYLKELHKQYSSGNFGLATIDVILRLEAMLGKSSLL